MSDEIQEVPAVTPAPEQDATAAPDLDVKAPEQNTDAPEEKKDRTFTQEELDEQISKRLARAQRKWEREQAQKQQEPVKIDPVKLDVSQFRTQEEYDSALQTLVESKAKEIIERQEAQRQQSQLNETYIEKETAALDRYEDFDQVAYNPNLRITDVMAQSIQASDVGPDIAYYLGLNPNEATKISRLPPILQAKEIGKLEAKLAAQPPKATKTSSAPAPIAPVKAKGSAQSYDTTDPRSVKSMSTSEWIEEENKREREKAKARYR